MENNPSPPSFSAHDAFTGNPPVPNGGDIWTVGPCTLERVVECCVLLLWMLHEGQRVYREVRVLAPAGSLSPDAIIQGVITDFRGRAPDEDPERIKSFVAARLTAHAVASQTLEDVVSGLPAVDERHVAVIVLEAGSLTDGVSPTLETEEWVEPVARLATSACERAKATDGYALIDTGQWRPTTPAALQTLEAAFGDCGVLTSDGTTAMDDLTAASQEIDRLADGGDMTSALELVRALDIPEQAKQLLRAHIFIKSRLLPQATELLDAVEASGEIKRSADAIRVAEVGFCAQAFDLSGRFLSQALKSAADTDEIGSVLDAAVRLDQPAIAQTAAKSLETADPDHDALNRYKLKTALDQGDFTRAARFAERLPNNASQFYDTLATALKPKRLDYAAILTTLEKSWPDLRLHAIQLLSQHAEQTGREVEGFALALHDIDPIPSSGQAYRLIGAMRRLLLAHSSGEDEIIKAMSVTLQTALARLAHTPSDVSVRATLGSLLTLEESGLLGRAALTAILTALVENRPTLTDTPKPRQVATQIEEKALWDAGKAWMKRGGAIMLGRSTCPPDLVPASFHAGVLWRIVSGLEGFAGHLNTPDEISNFQGYVSIATGFAAHLEGPDRDLDITGVKIASELLARSNRPQIARDMIEAVLQSADNDSARARAAWFAYGTIHRQTGDAVEGMMAICAALMVETAITPVAAWHEAIDVIRLLRELNEKDAALAYIHRAGAVLETLDLGSLYSSRLETMRLQIEQPDVLRASRSDPQRLGQFTVEVIANGKAVLQQEEDPAPVAFILAQALFELQADAPEAKPAQETLEALFRKMPPDAVERAKRLGRLPMIEDLTSLALELEGARYGRNLIHDVHPLVVLARRFLTRLDLTGEGAALALELLADQGLLERAEDGNESPARLPTDPTAVLQTAQSLAKTGLSVTLLGLNQDQQLVRLDVVDNQEPTPFVEAERTFSKERLLEWRQQFPNRYAFVSEEESRPGVKLDSLEVMSVFDQSLSSIGVSDLPPQRVVIIPDAKLADLPFNLLPCDGATAGETRTICAAPSLSWLAGAVNRRGARANPAICWVPTPGSGPKDLLPRVAQQLAPILRPHRISLVKDTAMPDGLKNAELAIVAAHGGIASLEGRYFRSIRDEAHRQISSEDLAHGLAGSKVAILFVCHGARLDTAPEGQATLGLARQLLDRGCSAVIGSPWPLRGDVPVRWLPHFLEAWTQDYPVADANAYANEKMGGLPDIRHALHVYGDPLVKR